MTVAVVVEEGRRVAVSPIIDAGLLADVGEVAVAVIMEQLVGAPHLTTYRSKRPAIVDVAPDGVHAGALLVPAADAGLVGHVLERAVAAVVKQVVLLMRPGIGDVQAGVAAVVVVGGSHRGADRGQPGHDVGKFRAELAHRMAMETARRLGLLLETDFRRRQIGRPGGGPRSSRPKRNRHQPESQNVARHDISAKSCRTPEATNIISRGSQLKLCRTKC